MNIKISIHASAKEATETACIFTSCFHISIHASAKEATLITSLFNCIFMISIHASAKEATLAPDCPTGEQKFQSTPPRRRRHYTIRVSGANYDFNPRLREGGDARAILDALTAQNFNPRLREGGDLIPGLIGQIATGISIHASAKEATISSRIYVYFK